MHEISTSGFYMKERIGCKMILKFAPKKKYSKKHKNKKYNFYLPYSLKLLNFTLKIEN